MKKLVILMLSVLSVAATSVSAHASARFVCSNATGQERPTLSIERGTMSWSEDWHSADSRAVFVGRESAPYSPWVGFQLYRMVDFYSTPDSSFMLAIGPKQGGQMIVYSYYDNDDHEEGVTQYVCRQVSR